MEAQVAYESRFDGFMKSILGDEERSLILPKPEILRSCASVKLHACVGEVAAEFNDVFPEAKARLADGYLIQRFVLAPGCKAIVEERHNFTERRSRMEKGHSG